MHQNHLGQHFEELCQEKLHVHTQILILMATLFAAARKSVGSPESYITQIKGLQKYFATDILELLQKQPSQIFPHRSSFSRIYINIK